MAKLCGDGGKVGSGGEHFPDILALHKAIVNETFGVAEEEKN